MYTISEEFLDGFIRYVTHCFRGNGQVYAFIKVIKYHSVNGGAS